MRRRLYISLLVVATAVLTASCNSQKPVAVVTAKSDSTYIAKRDSVHSSSIERDMLAQERILDSVSTEVWHRDVLRGDSVVAAKDSSVTVRTIYRDRYISRNIEVHDTTYIHNTDTVNIYMQDPVAVPVEVVREVDKSPFLRKSGIALWVIIGLAVLATIAGIVLKFAK